MENLDPLVIVPLLNEYLDHMTQIVFRHGATTEKIVGDAVHEIFGAPKFWPWVSRVSAFIPETHRGELQRGSLFRLHGPWRCHQHCSRLEVVNKFLGTRICVSKKIVEQIPEFKGRPVGTLKLKGKTEELKVFEPLLPDQAEAPATKAYREAFAKLEAGDAGASHAFAALVGQYGEDPLATFHLSCLLAGEQGVAIAFGEK